ncbi:MAG: sigma-70 family RNA polymerase sigma factor [Pirellulaceae bacterium]|nr:sigma-70 family RNA polymerase sigma factor [Pirellulaceae bacterium]
MSEIASTNATRPSLLDRAANRDEEAWRQLVDLYGPLIDGWCRRCNLDSHAVADVIQEVFITISKSIGHFRAVPGKGAFRSWLWMITRNKVIDRCRKYKDSLPPGGSSALRIISQLPDPESIPDDEPSDPDLLGSLTRRALAQLEAEFLPSTWQAFWRTVVDGLATDVVAIELGLSTASVRQARSRILRRLRLQLGDCQDK